MSFAVRFLNVTSFSRKYGATIFVTVVEYEANVGTATELLMMSSHFSIHCFSFLLSSPDISIVEKKVFLFELQNAYD